MQFCFFIVLPVCSVETFSSARSSPWRSCSVYSGSKVAFNIIHVMESWGPISFMRVSWYLQVLLRCHSGVNPAPCLCAPGLDPSQRQGVEELISAAPSRFDHAALFTILQKHTLLHRMNDSFSCLVGQQHTHTHWALHYPQCSWASGEITSTRKRKLSGTAVYIWSTNIEPGLLIPILLLILLTSSYHNNLYWLPEQSLLFFQIHIILTMKADLCVIRCQNQSVIKINK